MNKGNKLDKQYIKIAKKIIKKGDVVTNDRTGTGTVALFGKKIKHNMLDGLPLLTTKKIFYKGAIEELLWFLKGETNIKPLLLKNVNIWVGDAYKNYRKNIPYTLPGEYQRILSQEEFIISIKSNDIFAKKYGELGNIYGFQWRNWNNNVDQISLLICELISNPDSRRLMVTAWNPSDLDKAILPPCHYNFQCYTRILSKEEQEKWVINNPNDEIPKRALSLMWNQRSGDYALGIPINIVSYSILLTILSKITNMIPDNLIGIIGNVHLYSNHIDGIKEQIDRENIYPLPNLNLNGEFNNIKNYWKNGIFEFDRFINSINIEDFQIIDYKYYPKISFSLSN